LTRLYDNDNKILLKKIMHTLEKRIDYNNPNLVKITKNFGERVPTERIGNYDKIIVISDILLF